MSSDDISKESLINTKNEAKAWFSWIEWITLTAFLFSLFSKLYPKLLAWPMFVFAVYSFMLIYRVGYDVMALHLFDSLRKLEKWPKWAVMIFLYAICLITPIALVSAIIPFFTELIR